MLLLFITILLLFLFTISPIAAGAPRRPILLRPRASAPLPATLRQRPPGAQPIWFISFNVFSNSNVTKKKIRLSFCSVSLHRAVHENRARLYFSALPSSNPYIFTINCFFSQPSHPPFFSQSSVYFALFLVLYYS